MVVRTLVVREGGGGNMDQEDSKETKKNCLHQGGDTNINISHTLQPFRRTCGVFFASRHRHHHHGRQCENKSHCIIVGFRGIAQNLPFEMNLIRLLLK